MFVSKNVPEEQMEGRHCRPHLPLGSREGSKSTGGNPRGHNHGEELPVDPRLVGESFCNISWSLSSITVL